MDLFDYESDARPEAVLELSQERRMLDNLLWGKRVELTRLIIENLGKRLETVLFVHVHHGWRDRGRYDVSVAQLEQGV